MEVYRARARQLAARSAVSPAPSWPALVFAVGSERICLPVAELAEVLPCARCSPLPGSPAELLGVINVRGHICSVIDLARILGVTAAGDRSSGLIVLVRHAGTEVGLRVDHVDRIEPIIKATVTDRDGGPAVFCPQYLKGWTADRAAILDLGAVLSHRVFQSPNHVGATCP
jgi:purine-binding chemotaxis protein CheW